MHISSAIYGPLQFSKLIEELMDTVEMQRLRSVSHLSFVELVFPDATHTRFSHSLGTCYLAGMYAKQLGYDEESYQYKLVQSAALLHDVGHAAYSHALDFLYKKLKPHGISSHEEMGGAYVTGKHKMQIPGAGKLPKILKKYGLKPEDVAALIRGIYTDKVLQSIISGSVDADRLDFLTRDTYFTGARVGSVDTFRIISLPHRKDGEVVFPAKAASLLERMLDARQQMYAEVYIHRTVKIAETMLHHAADIASDELNDFYTLTDNELLNILEKSSNAIAAKLAYRIKYRKLFKIAWQLSMLPEHEELARALKKKSEDVRKKICEKSGALALVASPAVENASSALLDKTSIKIETEKSKTNYAFFNVYCDKADVEKVRDAAVAVVKEF